MTTRATSAPLPKFVMRGGTLSHELWKQEGHSQIHDSAAIFRLNSMQELQIGGTGAAIPAAGKQVP
jgi:hypothetical protein